jgi:hypothetical protein
MDEKDKNKIIAYKTKEREKHKRCKTCKFLLSKRKITYVIGNPTYVYYCAYTDKIIRTDDLLWDIKGCFCSLYEPEEVII